MVEENLHRPSSKKGAMCRNLAGQELNMTLQSITAGAIKYLQNRFCEEARPGVPEFAETDQPPERHSFDRLQADWEDAWIKLMGLFEGGFNSHIGKWWVLLGVV